MNKQCMDHLCGKFVRVYFEETAECDELICLRPTGRAPGLPGRIKYDPQARTYYLDTEKDKFYLNLNLIQCIQPLD